MLIVLATRKKKKCAKPKLTLQTTLMVSLYILCNLFFRCCKLVKKKKKQQVLMVMKTRTVTNVIITAKAKAILKAVTVT